MAVVRPSLTLPARELARAGAAWDPQAVAVRLLGPLALEGGVGDGHAVRASAHELLAYLALHPEGASRDQLLEALWPGADPRLSRQRLWQSASDARRLLGSALRRERERYRLDRRRVRVDLDELERLLAAADRAEDATAERELRERAFALFRGEPLAGADYPWAEGELRRLRACFVELAERLGGLRLAAGDARGALAACERGLAVDALDERLWRLAMEAEAGLGLREGLARRDEALRALLAERLGLEPERETRALYRRLLGQG